MKQNKGITTGRNQSLEEIRGFFLSLHMDHIEKIYALQGRKLALQKLQEQIAGLAFTKDKETNVLQLSMTKGQIDFNAIASVGGVELLFNALNEMKKVISERLQQEEALATSELASFDIAVRSLEIPPSICDNGQSEPAQ
jgi:hypothetical protein